MKFTTVLLTAVAVGGLVAPMTSATAATKHHAKPRHHAAEHGDSDTTLLREEVAQLQAEVSSLHAQVNSTQQTTVATQAQVAETSTQVAQVQSQIAMTPPITKADVHAEVASDLDAEHKNPFFKFRGITIQPGGFLELAGIYRQHNEGADVGSTFSGLPEGNSRTYYTSEGRFSARQSRVSFLASGKVNPQTTLSMWGEFDFLGAAQTANSNESNSYQPRIRNLYMQADWQNAHNGVHILAGQNWSLLTLGLKGITPRSETPPTGIDSQYVPGFAWARQPQVRLTADFADHHLWIAASAENPQTTVAGSVPGNVTNTIAPTSQFFAGDVGATPALNTISLNGTPDFIGKVAFEDTFDGHLLHLEGFALSRTFTARLAPNGTVAGSNENKAGYGFGGSAVVGIIPGMLEAQFSGMTGKGIGRYGSGQLSDVVFDSNGGIHPLKETMLLGGLLAHPTKMLDIYGYAGEEYERATGSLGGTYGYGLTTANDTGCFTEPYEATTGGTGTVVAQTCGGNTRRVRQATGGFWEKVYSGSFGKAQIGVQFSYTQRQLFASTYTAGTVVQPQFGEKIGMFSFRYYPFSN